MSDREEFEILVEKRLAGDVTADEQARLKTILAQDSALRAEFLIAVSQEAALKAIHRKPAAESAQPTAKARAKSGGARLKPNPWLAPLAACALLAMGVLLYLAFRQTPSASLPVVAKLRDPSAGINIIRGSKSIAVSNAMDILANDEIRSPQNGGVKIEYADATQVDLKESTTVIIDPTGRASKGKSIRIERGQLGASVSKQPADNPMIFVSAQAEAVVLGTRLELEATPISTKLSVIEGKVRFESVLDGKTLEVAGGEYAVAGKDAVFAVARIAPSPSAKSARVQDGIAALYTFREGTGDTVADVSGAGDPLNLTIGDKSAVTWLKNGGLDVHGVVNISPAQPAAKILRSCRNSGAITIETWIKSARIDPGTLRFVLTLHGGAGVHLLEIAQHGDDHANWQLMMETANQSVHHHGASSVVKGPQAPAAAVLTHLVFTRDSSGNARAYVNGVEQNAAQMPGDLSTWDEHHFLTIAGDGSARVWYGEFHLIAIYARALNATEVKTNFDAGE